MTKRVIVNQSCGRRRLGDFASLGMVLPYAFATSRAHNQPPLMLPVMKLAGLTLTFTFLILAQAPAYPS